MATARRHDIAYFHTTSLAAVSESAGVLDLRGARDVLARVLAESAALGDGSDTFGAIMLGVSEHVMASDSIETAADAAAALTVAQAAPSRRHDIAYFDSPPVRFEAVSESAGLSGSRAFTRLLFHSVSEALDASETYFTLETVARSVDEAVSVMRSAYEIIFIPGGPLTVAQAAPSRRHDIAYFDSPPVRFEAASEGAAFSETHALDETLLHAVSEILRIADGIVPYSVHREAFAEIMAASESSYESRPTPVMVGEAVGFSDTAASLSDILRIIFGESVLTGELIRDITPTRGIIDEPVIAGESPYVSIGRILSVIAEGIVSGEIAITLVPLIMSVTGESVSAGSDVLYDAMPFIFPDARSDVRLNRRRSSMFSEGAS